MIIQQIEITPIAFSDPPLLNADGVHERHVLRAIIEVHVDGAGRGDIIGIGECVGHSWQLDYLRLAGERLTGTSVFDAGALHGRIAHMLSGHDPLVDAAAGASWRKWADRTTPQESRGAAPVPAAPFDVQRVASALEVAFLDAQGKLLGVPVVDLLGGPVRERVPYSAYLFYKWEEHPALGNLGAVSDPWGEALDPSGIVEQARSLVSKYGFGSLKLKGGVRAPAEEIEALRALRSVFPEHPLRIDPNAAWTVETCLSLLDDLDGLLEYLEDPVPGMEGMARVARATDIPLATNMIVTSLDHVRHAVETGAVDIVLADHHYWGGLRGTVELGAVTHAAGFGLSMHSNSHLGISLAAMTAAAAATSVLTYACDTHYPWNAEEDVVAAPPRIVDGAVTVSREPGLGVQLDRTTVTKLHETYLSLGREHRNDKVYMAQIMPDFDPSLPRW